MVMACTPNGPYSSKVYLNSLLSDTFRGLWTKGGGGGGGVIQRRVWCQSEHMVRETIANTQRRLGPMYIISDNGLDIVMFNHM